jgi:hypothetical protein
MKIDGHEKIVFKTVHENKSRKLSLPRALAASKSFTENGSYFG